MMKRILVVQLFAFQCLDSDFLSTAVKSALALADLVASSDHP